MDESLRYYCIFKGTTDKPRKKQWQLRRKIQKMGYPMNRKTIAKYYRKAHEEYIIVKPRLAVHNHENLKHRLYLLQSKEPISAIRRVYSMNENRISHVIGGGNAFNVFVRARKDIDTLDFPILFQDLCGDYVQTIPQKNCDESSVFNANLPLEKGTFSVGVRKGLLQWDSMDWKICNMISFDPYVTYRWIAEELNVHQTTVKLRFVNNIEPCTYWLSGYFERGYLSYTGVMIQVRTDYEVGLFNRISKLSTSAYFLKTLKDPLFILTYVIDVKSLIRYFNSLLEQRRVEEFKYSVCYDYLPR